MIDETIAYLEERAAKYGGTAADMLDRTPVQLWDSPSEIREFWDLHDLSHIKPQADFPELADDWDNIIPEDSDINRARGAEIMTADEIDQAEESALTTAAYIDDWTVDDDPEFAGSIVEAIFG